LLKYSAIPAIVQPMTATAFPSGYKGMRGDILIALKKSQTLTAKELAARFGMTANALRRHLKELESRRRGIAARFGVGGPFAFAHGGG
jgi:DNA-binding transcriptional ArsR family regulator